MPQIDECVAVFCGEPTLPAGHNLQNSWNGLPVQFSENITYSCLSGYFFSHDRDLADFQVTCRGGGYFTQPVPWPKCIKGIINGPD